MPLLDALPKGSALRLHITDCEVWLHVHDTRCHEGKFVLEVMCMPRLMLLASVTCLLGATTGCQCWDSIVQFERQKNEAILSFFRGPQEQGCAYDPCAQPVQCCDPVSMPYATPYAGPYGAPSGCPCGQAPLITSPPTTIQPGPVTITPGPITTVPSGS